MVFSSILFCFYFLPAVLAVYYIVPRKFKNLILFISSLIFFAWGEPVYVSLMLFSTVVDYVLGRCVDHEILPSFNIGMGIAELGTVLPRGVTR